MKVRYTQYTFTRGQLGQDLDFRSDKDLYQAGAKQVKNAFVLPQGGVVKRKGLSYIATVQGALRVERFAFSDTQEYVLIFFDKAIALYRNDTLVFDSEFDVYVVGKKNPTVTASQTVILNGTTITITTGTALADVITDINAQTGTTGVSAENVDGYLQLYNEGSGTSIVIGSGTANTNLGLTAATYALTTVPWTASQVPTLDYSQKYNALFIVHKDVKPYELIRGNTDNAWTLRAMTFVSIPFDRFNTSQTCTPSATSGNITLTLSGSASYWTADHVGVKVKVNGGYANITSITSGLVANATVVTHLGVSTLTGTGADEAWREELWSTAHGYPRTVGQHQTRLVFGGTRDLPQSATASVTNGAYYDFDSSDTTDDLSWTKEIGTSEVNYIRAIVGRQDLHIFTNAEEFVIDGADTVSPSAGRIVPQNTGGIAEIKPLSIDSDLLYITADKKGVILSRFNADRSQYEKSKLTTLSQSIINDPVDLAFLSNYDDTQANLVFVVNGDGTMSTLTLDTEYQVAGWSTFETDGEIKSAATIDDALYVLVERSGVAYLEKLGTDEIYLDHWYRGTSEVAKSDWSGALSLAGQTVAAIVSESDTDLSTYYIHDDITIGSSGEVITSTDVQAVAVGFNYTCTLETLSIAFGLSGGLARGERLRKVRAEIRVRKTRQFRIDGYLVDNKKIGAALFDADLPDIDTLIDVGLSGIGTNQTVTIESVDPNPLRVLAITLVVAVRGGE